jgi:hypothetical protein
MGSAARERSFAMPHDRSWIRLVAGALLVVALGAARCDDTQSPKSVQVTGTLTTEGVECPALRGTDGKLYTLSGDLKGYKVGDEVCVSGRPAEVSVCMQGITLAVESIRPASECR